jgi:hypothetical protein
MSTSHTILRLLALLFFLAGLLLLRKPVFGQAPAPSPSKSTSQTINVHPLELAKPSPHEYPVHQIG